MRSLTPLVWLVAGLICLGGTDALAKEAKVDWSEYLEPKGGSKTQLTPTTRTTKVTATSKPQKTKKKAVAKKSAKKSKSSKRSARRR